MSVPAQNELDDKRPIGSVTESQKSPRRNTFSGSRDDNKPTYPTPINIGGKKPKPKHNKFKVKTPKKTKSPRKLKKKDKKNKDEEVGQVNVSAFAANFEAMVNNQTEPEPEKIKHKPPKKQGTIKSVGLSGSQRRKFKRRQRKGLKAMKNTISASTRGSRRTVLFKPPTKETKEALNNNYNTSRTSTLDKMQRYSARVGAENYKRESVMIFKDVDKGAMTFSRLTAYFEQMES